MAKGKGKKKGKGKGKGGYRREGPAAARKGGGSSGPSVRAEMGADSPTRTELYIVVTAGGPLDADQREQIGDALETLWGEVRREGWMGGTYGEGDPEALDEAGNLEVEANVVLVPVARRAA